MTAERTKIRLQQVLRNEVERLSRKTASELLDEFGEPRCWEVDAAETTFQVEAQILEAEDGYVHVAVSVDDGSPRRSLVPLSTSFLVHADDRVEKEV